VRQGLEAFAGRLGRRLATGNAAHIALRISRHPDAKDNDQDETRDIASRDHEFLSFRAAPLEV
jgi:hypothetical protein